MGDDSPPPGVIIDGDVSPDTAASGEVRTSRLGDSVEPGRPSWVEPWTCAGWGHAERLQFRTGAPSAAPKVSAPHAKLGQWSATAICANDITSSVLYVTALCTIVSGVYAPLALAMVGVVLYLFRKIYEEVGSALPLNGGAYNVLLNTTSKYKASIAAGLTLLSYVATAVISSTEAPTTPTESGTRFRSWEGRWCCSGSLRCSISSV